MAILAPRATSATAGDRFAAPPWADDAPERRALGERLGADHLARRLDATVARLDLTPLVQCYAGTGSLPHRPDLLLRAVLFEVQRGQHSPAAWHRDARESEPVRWLLRGCAPARSCWYAFRDRVAPLLDGFHRQVLHQAITEELTPATRAALDGTPVAANASRHRLVNEGALQHRAEQLAQATAADARGQAPAATPAWMAATPAGRQQQQRRLRQAQARLAQLQERNGRKRASKRQQRQRVVVSLSDPGAALGRDKEGVYRPLYNVQLVDDLDSPFVLAYDVFAQPNDAGVLGPMLGRLLALVGHPPEKLLTDAAYAGGADLAAAAAAHVTVFAPWQANDYSTAAETKAKQIPKGEFPWLAAEQTYVCPQGHRLVYEGSSRQKRSGPEAVQLHRYRCPPAHCTGCPLRQQCTPNPQAGRTISRGEHEGLIEALRGRMATAEAKELYRLRRQTVELVNADWKQHRKLRRFSGRGLARARCQVGLLVLAHNLLTLLAEGKKAKVDHATDGTPREITA
jgi:hypothetical protein